MKTLAFMPRRPDISRQAFRRYYEDKHAPLGAGYFPFTNYVRNHLSEPEGENEQGPAGFDCFSEFWMNDVRDAATLMDGPVGAIMKKDERNFTDQPRISPFGTEEVLVSGPPRDREREGQLRTLILIDRIDDGAERPALIDAARAIGTAAACERVTIDFLTPFRPGLALGADAVISLWRKEGQSTEAPIDLPSGWRETGRYDATVHQRVNARDANASDEPGE